jgi:transcriptional repressor NrdR
MRFASVYQGWESLADFEAAINVLRANREYAENDESFELDETKRLTDR